MSVQKCLGKLETEQRQRLRFRPPVRCPAGVAAARKLDIDPQRQVLDRVLRLRGRAGWRRRRRWCCCVSAHEFRLMVGMPMLRRFAGIASAFVSIRQRIRLDPPSYTRASFDTAAGDGPL